MIFDWDENKEKLNIKNHDGIDFDEASEVFYDDKAFEFLDTAHSTANEKRFVCVGNSSKRLLRVSYTIRVDVEGGEIIRIISARKGRNSEEDLYYGQRKH